MKKLIILVITTAMTTQAASFSVVVKRVVTSRFFGYAVVVAAAWADGQSTLDCVNLPRQVCVEGGPALKGLGIDPATREGRKSFIEYKLLQGVGLPVAEELFHHWKPQYDRSVYIVNIGGAIGTGFVAWHNQRLTEKLRESQ